VNPATIAARHDERPTDEELDAAEADLADAIEEQADRYRKGEW
jgi:hypothetical protein